MKKAISFLVCTVLLFSSAAAEQTVVLPEGRYVIDVPDDLKYSPAEEVDEGIDAYISDTLEMDYCSYPATEDAPTLQERAEKLAADGTDAEMRTVNGIEMLVYRVTDEADGAPCIGYAFMDGTQTIEIFFWYATQEAADLTRHIMETIRENDS